MTRKHLRVLSLDRNALAGFTMDDLGADQDDGDGSAELYAFSADDKPLVDEIIAAVRGNDSGPKSGAVAAALSRRRPFRAESTSVHNARRGAGRVAFIPLRGRDELHWAPYWGVLISARRRRERVHARCWQ